MKFKPIIATALALAAGAAQAMPNLSKYTFSLNAEDTYVLQGTIVGTIDQRGDLDVTGLNDAILNTQPVTFDKFQGRFVNAQAGSFRLTGTSGKSYILMYTGALGLFVNANGPFGSLPSNVYRFKASLTPLQSAVPEPATWAMMILGFGLVGARARRARRPAAVAA